MGILDKLRGRERGRVSYSSGLAPISRGGRLLSGKMSDPVTARGAGLRMQAMWRSFPEWKKAQLRRVMKDSDHDGVPDKFDCQPFNARRQDNSRYYWECIHCGTQSTSPPLIDPDGKVYQDEHSDGDCFGGSSGKNHEWRRKVIGANTDSE